MTDDLSALHAETEAALAAAADLRAWDAVRVAVLGRNGRLTALLRDLGKAPPEQRRERGAALNQLKDALTGLIEARRAALEAADLDARLAAERLDPTLPPRPRETGLIHPISRTMEEIAAIFGAMGCDDRRRSRRRIRLAQFRRAEHPGASSGARRPRHVLPAGRRATCRRRCCARRPRRCRSAPC